jgi:hypothetical protein
MCKALHSALLGALVLAGCGNGSVPVTSMSSSSTVGAGGSTSSGAGGGGGSGGAGCLTATISVDGDGPTNYFDAACMGSHGAAYTSHANGYLGYAGAGQPEQLFISGCVNDTASPTDGSLSLTVPQSGSGSATTGAASYANGVDTFMTDTAVTLMVTELDNMMVKGSYTATVSSTNNGAKMLSGTFAVCRVPDVLPP